MQGEVRARIATWTPGGSSARRLRRCVGLPGSCSMGSFLGAHRAFGGPGGAPCALRPRRPGVPDATGSVRPVNALADLLLGPAARLGAAAQNALEVARFGGLRTGEEAS